jgi:hypothetical protein
MGKHEGLLFIYVSLPPISDQNAPLLSREAPSADSSDLQLDLRGSENESNKFNSSGRYADWFANDHDSVAINLNRVPVKSNRERVWTERREGRDNTCVMFLSLISSSSRM